jgi:hypothetical protein
VLEGEWLKGGCSVLVLLVEGRIEVVEQAVASVDGILRRLGDERPAEEFLRERGVAVMVAIDGLNAPKIAHRADGVSVVFPTNPQMAETQPMSAS